MDHRSLAHVQSGNIHPPTSPTGYSDAVPNSPSYAQNNPFEWTTKTIHHPQPHQQQHQQQQQQPQPHQLQQPHSYGAPQQYPSHYSSHPQSTYPNLRSSPSLPSIPSQPTPQPHQPTQSSPTPPSNFNSLNLSRDAIAGLGNMNSSQVQQLMQALQQSSQAQTQAQAQTQTTQQQSHQQQQQPPQQQGYSLTSYSHQQGSSGAYRSSDEFQSPPPLASTPPPVYSRPNSNPQRQQQQQQYHVRPEVPSHYPSPSPSHPSNVGGGGVGGPSSEWSLQQVQQLQSQILQFNNQKQQQKETHMQQHQQQQQQPQSVQHSYGAPSGHQPPPLGLSRTNSLSSTYDESPRSVYTAMSSPSQQRSFGFASALSSPYDPLSSKSRSHSRSLSVVGALNPNAHEFNPTFSSPNSPSAQSNTNASGHSPALQDRRLVHGRAASSTPTVGFGSSSSPPNSIGFTAASAPSQTRTLEGSNVITSMSPAAQQQQQQLNDEKLAALGLPTQPFDARELDAQIARERDDHAAYIYNFRVQVCQGWLDGNCPYDAYTCLPERDSRVLTDAGFLTLVELESRIASGCVMQYACYDVASAQLQYRPGKIVLGAAPEYLVDFTEADSKHQLEGRDTNRLALRVTPDHDMYVKVDHDDLAPVPFAKVKAAQLVSMQSLRMVARAEHGVLPSLPTLSPGDTDAQSPAKRLGLDTEEKLNAFLELYGTYTPDARMRTYTHT